MYSSEYCSCNYSGFWRIPMVPLCMNCKSTSTRRGTVWLLTMNEPIWISKTWISNHNSTWRLMHNVSIAKQNKKQQLCLQFINCNSLTHIQYSRPKLAKSRMESRPCQNQRNLPFLWTLIKWIQCFTTSISFSPLI